MNSDCIKNPYMIAMSYDPLVGQFPFQKGVIIVLLTPDAKPTLFRWNLFYAQLRVQFARSVFLH